MSPTKHRGPDPMPRTEAASETARTNNETKLDPMNMPHAEQSASQTPADTDPQITIFATKYIPSPENEKFAERAIGADAIGMPLSEALTRAWPTDAHLAAYEPAAIDGVTIRLASGALAEGIEVRMVMLIGDVDDPVAHDSKTAARDEWRAETLPRIEASGLAYYTTNGGYRVLARCDEWLRGPEDHDAWTDHYRGWCAYLEQTHELTLDPSCADWTRLYRLPNVMRENIGEQRADVIGEIPEWSEEHYIKPAKSTTRAKSLALVEPTGGPPAVVEPLVLELADAVEPAWNDHNRNGWRFVFLGWLAGKGWSCDERAALINVLADRDGTTLRGKYIGDNRRVTPINGPNDETREILGDSFGAVDAIVKKHPNSLRNVMARVQAKRLAAHANDDGAAIVEEQRTDLGNARRLVRLHGADLRYFRARGLWYCWDGARWKADATGEIERNAKAAAETVWDDAKTETDDDKRKAAFRFAAECQNRARITNMIALAETEPGVPVTADMLDADPWLLNVQNGTLDLRTGELREPDRDLLMTKQCATAYEHGARSDLWDGFLRTLTGGDSDLAEYLQRAIGYALFGAWREKAFWFGYGPPDGGKSTFLGAVAGVLGDYAVSADAETWMIRHNVGGNRGDVTRLLGARLVTTIEVKASARFDQQLMKKVTGGDVLTAAAKYEGEIQFDPTFALWFGANDRPIIPDDDEGFWSRVRCVPFTHVIPKAEQDQALKEKLTAPEHAPAVLAWAVAGCLAWQRDGIGSCAAVEAATTAYRRDMNLAAGFFDECVVLDPTGQVDATTLRNRYVTWCSANSVRQPLAGAAWGKRLEALGVTGGDDASRVNKKRRWFGIRLRDD